MGQLFGSLTAPNTALAMPGGGTFVGTPQQVLNRANSALPSSSQMLGNDPLHPQINEEAVQSMPKITKPSFEQAAKTGATPGGLNATSPGLTKAGKLATLLTSGLQGALAGRAASEQMIAQTGGRRAGGAGMGFQAGFTLPWQRAEQQAQAQLAQAGTQPVETPYGQMPAALASKILTPYLGYQGKIGAAQIAGGSREQAAQTEAQGRVQAQQIAKRFIPVPNVGLYDTQSGQMIPETAQGITITPDIAKQFNMPEQFVGRPMRVSDFSSLERANTFGSTVTQGANGPALVQRNPVSPDYGRVTPLGLGNPSLGRPMQVGDVNNPGETRIMTGGQAIASGAPGAQSASVQVPKAAAKAEVPKNIGDLKVAFTTATQHAELLKQAYTALNNGDQQTLNSLKNRFANEFGVAGPVTAKAIASAYTREVNKMLSSNHMTDADLREIGSTLDPTRQSPQQVLGVLNGYQALAQSKMNMLNQQKQSAINQSQPNRGKSAPSGDPLGIR